MNIARAANRAAFLLMIFGLVALVACQQGPAGPAGAAGAAGKPGDPGLQGEPGPPGPSALQAVDSATHVILINDNEDSEIGDVTEPDTSANIADLFSGGKEPLTFSISKEPAAGSTFRAEINGDMIVVTKRNAQNDDPDDPDDYVDGTALTVKATDASGASATKQIAIKTNRPPTALDSYSSAPSLPTGPAYASFVVGTQVELGSGDDAKAAWNVISTTATPDRHLVAGDRADPPANYYFLDEDHEDVTLAITKIGGTGTADDEEHIRVSLDGDGKLTITGVKSTWDADATPPKHKPVPVVLTATDTGGLKDEITLYVWVDGAPEVKTTGGEYADAHTLDLGDDSAGKAVINGLVDFFSDPEARDVTAVTGDVSTNAENIATAAINADGDLVVTPVNQGRAVITFYVSSTSFPADVAPVSPNPSTTLAQGVDRDGDGDIDDDDGTWTNAIDGALAGTQYAMGSITVTVTP